MRTVEQIKSDLLELRDEMRRVQGVLEENRSIARSQEEKERELEDELENAEDDEGAKR